MEEKDNDKSEADFKEIDRLMLMDDILFETQEQFLIESILDFVDGVELSAEQIILSQIYPSISLASSGGSQSESSSVQISKKYISLDKQNFLQERRSVKFLKLHSRHRRKQERWRSMTANEIYESVFSLFFFKILNIFASILIK